MTEHESKPRIEFYRANDPYGVFSNFDTRHPFTIDGVFWPSSEHYFQAKKFEGTSREETIRAAISPAHAALLGRSRDYPIRPDWESVKDDVMRKALYEKFTQHPDAAQALADTGNAELVEHTENDSYWADGGDGSGKNMLGILLMELRTELRLERFDHDWE
jgi:ribA/ribD-fused uncharacterized protein